MSSFNQICSSSLGKKYVMALTGLLLGGFLLLHAAGNSLIFQGRDAFAAYAEHLRSYGLLLPAAGLLLLVVLIVHAVTGFSLALGNMKARGSRRAIMGKPAGRRSWTARTMPWTGASNFVYLLVHLGSIRFADQALPVADRVDNALSHPLLGLLHAVGIAVLCLHVSHGFWATSQSLGIHHPLWNSLIRRCGCLASAGVAAVFLGIVALHVLDLR